MHLPPCSGAGREGGKTRERKGGGVTNSLKLILFLLFCLKHRKKRPERGKKGEEAVKSSVYSPHPETALEQKNREEGRSFGKRGRGEGRTLNFSSRYIQFPLLSTKKKRRERGEGGYWEGERRGGEKKRPASNTTRFTYNQLSHLFLY